MNLTIYGSIRDSVTRIDYTTLKQRIYPNGKMHEDETKWNLEKL